MFKMIVSSGLIALLSMSARLFAQTPSAQGAAQRQGTSMQGMDMSDGGMMQGGMMADGGMMGGMGGMMADGGTTSGGMMGGMSCSQMMGDADVTVQNTKDGATMKMRAKSKDQVQRVQQMARMMKSCMSGGGEQR